MSATPATASLTSVLAAVRAYGAQPVEPHDTAIAAEFEKFIAEHADCLLRSCAPGHLTGSAWVLDAKRQRTLLTHHRKLDIWVQLGGHADGDADLLAVALREAAEESGLTRLRATSPRIFDLDRHWIPARKTDPAHWHYDVRFMIEADPAESLVISSESKDLAWVELANVAQLNPEESMVRMVRKTAPWT